MASDKRNTHFEVLKSQEEIDAYIAPRRHISNAYFGLTCAGSNPQCHERALGVLCKECDEWVCLKHRTSMSENETKGICRRCATKRGIKHVEDPKQRTKTKVRKAA